MTLDNESFLLTLFTHSCQVMTTFVRIPSQVNQMRIYTFKLTLPVNEISLCSKNYVVGQLLATASILPPSMVYVILLSWMYYYVLLCITMYYYVLLCVMTCATG